MNSFGRRLRLTTFGESHGSAIGGVLDGFPSGIRLDEAQIQAFMNERRPGQSHWTTQRKESDHIEWLSGFFEGVSTGAPIGFVIKNRDAKSSHYDHLKDVFRPNHADWTTYQKYGIRDHRGGGRASARETAVRVAGGALAQLMLQQKAPQVTVYSGLVAMGHIQAQHREWQECSENPFYCPDPSVTDQMEALITQCRKNGDSIGARVDVIAEQVPVGLGDPHFAKLDAQLASAMMSIPAVKGVEIGDGFDCIQATGSAFQDSLTPSGYVTNHSGGIIGGISNGQSLRVSLAIKPTSSIQQPAQTIQTDGSPTTLETKGRHDPCIGIRAVAVAKAMMWLVLADAWLSRHGESHQSPLL